MITKERLKNLHDLATQSNTPNWLEYVYLNCSQLEYHEALFMHYSMAIASTTRGEIINLQKAMLNELEIIELLKKDDSNKLCAYKLGVGKILIGQRGSGISSTLIDECLKYNRPLIVEFGQRANQLKKQYPNLRIAQFIKNRECFESKESNINWGEEQVNVDLLTCRNNVEIMSKIVKEIRAKVGAIGTVGVSYELEEEQPIWIPKNSELPKIREKVTKELAESMMDDYTKNILGDGYFDSSKSKQHKYDIIIKLMSE